MKKKKVISNSLKYVSNEAYCGQISLSNFYYFFLTTRSPHLEGMYADALILFSPITNVSKSNDGQKANEGAFYNGTCYTYLTHSSVTTNTYKIEDIR